MTTAGHVPVLRESAFKFWRFRKINYKTDVRDSVRRGNPFGEVQVGEKGLSVVGVGRW